MAAVGNIVEGTINTNYKAIIEVLIEVYFEIIIRRNAIVGITRDTYSSRPES